MTIAGDLNLAGVLDKRLGELIDEAKDAMLVPKDFKEYHQALGMIEAWRQIKLNLLPTLVEEIQRS